MLQNPAATQLDEHNYPVQEEIKSQNIALMSPTEKKQLFENAPNQEMSRVKIEIFPLV